MHVQKFDTTTQLNHEFALQIHQHLAAAIKERGTAYLVVSGGRTPQALFSELSRMSLDWSRVVITLADDRYLAPTEADSNERLVKASLLVNLASAASFISLYAPAASAELAVSALLNRVQHLPTFDVLILGMGEDGHTASLFPCSQELTSGLADDAADLLAVNPTTAPYQRISFSRRRLQNSRAIYLHLVGESKLRVLDQAQHSDDVMQMPIRAFIQQTDPELSVMYAAN